MTWHGWAEKKKGRMEWGRKAGCVAMWVGTREPSLSPEVEGEGWDREREEGLEEEGSRVTVSYKRGYIRVEGKRRS